MPLRDSLLAVRRLEDLPGLAHELGLAPCWEEVSAEALGLTADPDETRAAVVGRRGPFVAIGLTASDPASASRRAARALAARGLAAIVIAAAPDRPRLAISAGFADCPTLLLRPDRPSAADLARLSRGAITDELAPAALAARWAEALAGEELGGRFFLAFRRHLREFIAALPARVPVADRHAIALLGLTRILFLYFVQDKGWLDGRPRFLREELDRCLAAGRRVEAGFLSPLFFGTLNVPRHRRAAGARRFGVVPFLNGGLFERHPLERRWQAGAPDALWRDAFDDLFERYHFATALAPGAIGPDMLGQVFEGVMDPDERRAEGAFYTPAALVDELVEATLGHWLALRLDVRPDHARRLLRHPTAIVVRTIRSIAILDPAAGSGAFLLGALRRLVSIRVAAGENRRAATRATLAVNLFGVDRNPSAVRLAELRLWLEVIAAEPPGDPAEVEPLPNLDSFVRQGDSLAEPIGFSPRDGAPHRTRMGELRGRLVGATGGTKRRLVAQLRRVEIGAARASLDHAIAAQERRIAESKSATHSPDLFQQPPVASPAARRFIAACRTERRRLRQIRRRLRDAEELPWFQFEVQFADVMARGGFDVVIGNPPWVRAEALPAGRRRELKRRFQWFRGDGSGYGYAHLPDLSVAFVERGFGLLRPGGVTGILVPAKLLTARYASTAREELARRGTLLALENLTARAGAAFDATVFPLALVAARRAPPPGHKVATRLLGERPSLLQSSLERSGWHLDTDPCDALLSRAAAAHPTLGERLRVRLGVKTGLDRAFLDPPPDTEAKVIRRALRGREIRAFQVSPTKRLLWPHDDAGRVLETLPPAAARHLASHERALRRRADYRGGPWWTLFRTGPAVVSHRVVWRDLAPRLECAALASPGIILLNTAYLIPAGNRETALRLAGWLNSTWIRRIAETRATVAASGFRRFNAAVIEALPLPDAVLQDDGLLRLARDAMSSHHADQDAIDRRCAELLGIGPDTRRPSSGGR